MTTLENTISILKGLPEPDLIRVQALAEKLFQRHEDKMADEAVGRFLKPMSREDFLQDIEEAENEDDPLEKPSVFFTIQDYR